MRLNYHQHTHDLLTQAPIDPANFLKRCADYEAAVHALGDRIREWCSLDLFQREPTFSDQHLQLLDKLEQEHQVKLPEAVREWYTLDYSLALMRVAPYAGWPVEIENLGKPIYNFYGDLQMLDYGLMEIVPDPQWGRWCVRMDAGDDPPVVTLRDSDIPQDRQAAWKMEEFAPRFSDFIYLYFWDWLAEYRSAYHVGILHIWQLPTLRLTPEYQVPLDRLRQHFKEVSQQHGHRFYGDGQRLKVQLARDAQGQPLQPEGLGGGRFYADSEAALRDLIFRLWGDSPPLHRMQAYDDDSQRVLDDLKCELGKA